MADVEMRLTKRADQTLLGRTVSTLGRIFYSSNFSIYNLLISFKRSAVVRAFPNYINSNKIADDKKRDLAITKYQKAFDAYIVMLERYVTENIYTKMKKEVSTLEEQRIMASYYRIADVKATDTVDHKNRLQTLLINMDWAFVTATKNDGFIEKYKAFYLYNIEELYKASLRHNSILLANIKYGDKEPYNAIYALIDTYIKEILPTFPETKENNAIIKDYKKYVSAIDSFEHKDFNEIRKRIMLLNFAGELFEFSFPTLAREQCYLELINTSRIILTNKYLDADKFAAYEVLLDAIEEYVENILLYKRTWLNAKDKQRFLQFNKKWEVVKKLARIDYDSFKKQREILFIKFDTLSMESANIKNPEVKDYYRERLLILHALPTLKGHPGSITGKWLPMRKAHKEETDAKVTYVSPNEPTSNVVDLKDLVNNTRLYGDYVKNIELDPNFIGYNTNIGIIRIPATISADGIDIPGGVTNFDPIDGKGLTIDFSGPSDIVTPTWEDEEIIKHIPTLKEINNKTPLQINSDIINQNIENLSNITNIHFE